MKNKHKVSWTDDGRIGISHCEEFALDLILEPGKTEICPRCQYRLTLHWHVYVRERKP